MLLPAGLGVAPVGLLARGTQSAQSCVPGGLLLPWHCASGRVLVLASVQVTVRVCSVNNGRASCKSAEQQASQNGSKGSYLKIVMGRLPRQKPSTLTCVHSAEHALQGPSFQVWMLSGTLTVPEPALCAASAQPGRD